jgi:hypothetical protein
MKLAFAHVVVCLCHIWIHGGIFIKEILTRRCFSMNIILCKTSKFGHILNLQITTTSAIVHENFGGEEKS